MRHADAYSEVARNSIGLHITYGQSDSYFLKDFCRALCSQYKRELAVLFVIFDVVLGLTLFSDVQAYVLKGAAPDTVTAASVPAPITQNPVVTPITQAAASVPAWPLHGHVTTEFGDRTPYQRNHSGIDISSYQRAGTADILPIRSGTVLEAGRDGGLGNRVVIDHGEGLVATYGHLDSIAVDTGQTVNPGESIGKEGSTGNSTGPHLHLELRQQGQIIDPRTILN